MGNSYIFFAYDIGGVGGGQRYIQNKSRYLFEEGWNVYIICASISKLILDYNDAILIEDCRLRAAPRYLGSQRIDDLLKTLTSSLSIDMGGDIVIESHATHLALWGELLAKWLKARHLVYLLGEDNGVLSFSEQEFFAFKLLRHELATINPVITKNLFEGYCDVPPDQCYSLKAYMGDAIKDVPYPKMLEKDYDGIILSVSRLEKTYLGNMLKGVAQFCQTHTEKTFCLIHIGDAKSDEYRKSFLSVTNPIKNLDTFILGSLSPIPASLLRLSDVAIAKANAARQCAGFGLPTISYQLDYDEPAGFLGYDIENSLCHVEVPEVQKLEILLNRCLTKNEFDGVSPKYEISVNSSKFEEHFRFLDQSEIQQNYFDTRQTNPKLNRLLSSVWIRLFHNTNYDILLSKLRNKKAIKI